MKSNFDFLNRYWPALAQIGATAENYVYSDPNACVYKLGMFAERLVQEILVFEHIAEPVNDNTHANRIRILKRAGLLPHEIDNTLYILRKTRNSAYVLDEENELYKNLNKAMIHIEKVEEKYDIQELREMIEKHVQETGSEKGQRILDHFEDYLPKFKKIIPIDYKKMVTLSTKLEEKGMSREQAQMEAFYESFQVK